jgi:hypothetical protein
MNVGGADKRLVSFHFFIDFLFCDWWSQTVGFSQYSVDATAVSPTEELAVHLMVMIRFQDYRNWNRWVFSISCKKCNKKIKKHNEHKTVDHGSKLEWGLHFSDVQTNDWRTWFSIYMIIAIRRTKLISDIHSPGWSFDITFNIQVRHTQKKKTSFLKLKRCWQPTKNIVIMGENAQWEGVRTGWNSVV